MNRDSCEQIEVFREEEMIPWKSEWQNMPEYDVQDLAPVYQIIINFSCMGDVEDLAKLLNQNIRAGTSRQLKSIWFPEAEIGRMMNKRYIQKVK